MRSGCDKGSRALIEIPLFHDRGLAHGPKQPPPVCSAAAFLRPPAKFGDLLIAAAIALGIVNAKNQSPYEREVIEDAACLHGADWLRGARQACLQTLRDHDQREICCGGDKSNLVHVESRFPGEGRSTLLGEVC